MAESEDREMATVAHGITGFDTQLASLGAITEGHPEYAPLLVALARWIESHQREDVDPRELVKAFPAIDPGTLTKVFRLLSQSGRFRRVYKVVTPTGILPDEFAEPPVRSSLPGVVQYDIIPLLISKTR